MSDAKNAAVSGPAEPLPKTCTWWHPLLARLLDHLLATAYTVVEEVLVGKLPLRVDILLICRAEGRLSQAAQRDLAALVPLLDRFTLLQQIQQFRKLGEEFAMQHKDAEYMGELEEELQMAVLEAIPAEKFVRRLTQPSDEQLETAVLEAIPPERRLRGLPPEERLKGLSQEELAHLRELLERK
jgi:hypothetical protein